MCRYLGYMRLLGLIVSLAPGMWLLDGCGDDGGRVRQQNSAPAPSTFVAKVEHQCGVAYTDLKVRGEPLGFTCGETSTGQHFGAIYTHRTQCQNFLTIVVDVGDYRRQGCMSWGARHPFAVITCGHDNELVVVAHTRPPTRSATVRLSTGQEATSRVLSLDAAAQTSWGGLYFNVLPPGPPTNAILIERDQAGRAFRHVSLTVATVIEECPGRKGAR
jgi:hypothetical protein